MIISVENLKKSYFQPTIQGNQKILEVLKGISFSVEKGEIFGILGPNGAGKTTTLEILEGLNQQTSGTALVFGLDTISQTTEIKKRIGVQLQSSEYLAHLTLGEQLLLFGSLYSNKNINIQKVLLAVDLADKEHSQVKELSGGQKQRFTIATALVNDPEILFLDEPTTGLDPAARRSLWQLITKLNKQGMTIVLTTHFMEEAEFLCNRVAIMDAGEILEMNEPRVLIDKLSDGIQVSFLTDKNIDPAFFSSISEVKKVYTHYPKIFLELTHLDKLSAIVELLKNNRIPFSGFMVKTATLEDVYLNLTGHTYEE